MLRALLGIMVNAGALQTFLSNLLLFFINLFWETKHTQKTTNKQDKIKKQTHE